MSFPPETVGCFGLASPSASCHSREPKLSFKRQSLGPMRFKECSVKEATRFQQIKAALDNDLVIVGIASPSRKESHNVI